METEAQITHEELGRRMTNHAFDAYQDWESAPEPRQWQHQLTVARKGKPDVRVTINVVEQM